MSRLLFLTSFSSSGAWPRNLHFYNILSLSPHQRALSCWLQRHCPGTQGYGDRTGVCLSCSKLYLRGPTLAKNITGAQSILTEGMKDCCSLQRSPLRVPYVIKPRTCALTTLVTLPRIILSGFLVLLLEPALFPGLNPCLLCSLPISIDTRSFLALLVPFLGTGLLSPTQAWLLGLSYLGRLY